MNDSPSVRTRSGDAQRTSSAALVFGGHRGWLHYPKDCADIRAAVVFCQPVGREARNAHRSWWVMAETLAASGFAVLRYDHLGTGESLPLPEHADGWQHWLRGVELAADWTRRETNASALVLVGLRLGASLAALAAPRVGADALMLFAPVAKGRAWLRELRGETARVSGQARSAERGSAIDADGLWLEPATVAGIGRFDLGSLDTTPPFVFLAASSGGTALSSHLRTLGAAVELGPFDECHALFRDAHLNAYPAKAFGRAASWLRDIAKGWPASPAAFRQPASTLRIAGGSERAMAFGNRLHGVLCRPDFPGPGKKAVIIVNTGGNPRAGSGGFATETARKLAGRGIASLRFDFAGLGDSPFDASWRSHVYETPRDDDFDAAIALLRSHGFTNIIAAGVCSGGYHALNAASRDARVAAGYAINAAVLAWRAGDPLDMPETAAQRLLSFRNWRRALAGEIAWRAVLSSLTLRLKRRLRFRLDGKLTRELRASMRALSKRGGRARLVVGSADASLDELETHFGRGGRWFARLPGMSVGIIEGLDHGLSFRASRRLALDDLVSYVEALPVVAAQTEAGTRRTPVEVDLPIAAAQ